MCREIQSQRLLHAIVSIMAIGIGVRKLCRLVFLNLSGLSYLVNC